MSGERRINWSVLLLGLLVLFVLFPKLFFPSFFSPSMPQTEIHTFNEVFGSGNPHYAKLVFAFVVILFLYIAFRGIWQISVVQDIFFGESEEFVEDEEDMSIYE